MSERFSKIEAASIRRRSLEERLKDHLELRGRFEMILEIVENTAGDVEKADEAERRVIEELRQLGHEVLHEWARCQHQKREEGLGKRPDVSRKVKKFLLVHPLRKDRDQGADFQARAWSYP